MSEELYTPTPSPTKYNQFDSTEKVIKSDSEQFMDQVIRDCQLTQTDLEKLEAARINGKNIMHLEPADIKQIGLELGPAR